MDVGVDDDELLLRLAVFKEQDQANVAAAELLGLIRAVSRDQIFMMDLPPLQLLIDLFLEADQLRVKTASVDDFRVVAERLELRPVYVVVVVHFLEAYNVRRVRLYFLDDPRRAIRKILKHLFVLILIVPEVTSCGVLVREHVV